MATAVPQEPVRILIVDDQSMHRLGLAHVIRSASSDYNCTFVCAASGPEALKICAEHEFNIIIMDYNMRPMNGAEATQKILEIKPHSYVIGCTAEEDPRVINECKRAGMKEVLSKDWVRVGKAVKGFIKEHVLCSAMKRTSMS
ncbi:MAG TPA: response regulator transcription factor [Rhabdochlamydiaceae bacterium]|jgi:CheY-like chemotaxis protein|nr:response regulator transcription factor [Rhabdochlamydiaceae bacterium]